MHVKYLAHNRCSISGSHYLLFKSHRARRESKTCQVRFLTLHMKMKKPERSTDLSKITQLGIKRAGDRLLRAVRAPPLFRALETSCHGKGEIEIEHSRRKKRKGMAYSKTSLASV